MGRARLVGICLLCCASVCVISSESLAEVPVFRATAVGSQDDELIRACRRMKVNLPVRYENYQADVRVVGVGGGTLAGVSGLEGMLLEGMSKFIVKRAKQEAVAWTIVRLSKVLCGEQKKSAKLMTATCTLIKAAVETNLELVTGKTFKAVLVNDFKEFPGRLAEIMEESDFGDASTAHAAFCSLNVGQGLYRGLRESQHPMTLVAGAVEKLAEVGSCRKMLDDFSPECLEVDVSGANVNLCSGVSHANIEVVLWIVRALESEVLHHSTQRVSAQAVKDAVDTLVEQSEFDDDIRKAAHHAVARLVHPVVRLAEVLHTLTTAGLAPDQRTALAREAIAATLSLMGHAMDHVLLPDSSRTAMAQALENGAQAVDAAADSDKVDMANQLERTKQLLGSMDGNRALVGSLLEVSALLFQGDYAAAVAGLLALPLFPRDKEPFKTVLKFAPLLTEAGSAQSSDEVAAAIEAAATPAGSWMVRKQKTWALGLGAKASFAGFYEWNRKTGEAGYDTSGGGAGLFMPVGLEVSRSLGDSNHHLGLMAHFLDLGAMTSCRLWDTDDGGTPDTTPEFGFEQVLSLGLGLIYGPGKSPFVFSLSGSYSPGLRSVEKTDTADPAVTTRETLPAWRVLLGFGIDVPFFIW